MVRTRRNRHDDGINATSTAVGVTDSPKYLTITAIISAALLTLTIVFLANERSVTSGLSGAATEVIRKKNETITPDVLEASRVSVSTATDPPTTTAATTAATASTDPPTTKAATATSSTDPPTNTAVATDPPETSSPIIPEQNLTLIDSQPMPKQFRFYVYDHFATNELSPQNLSECIKRQHARSGNCDWGLHTCVDDGTSDSRYAARRRNFNADVVIADLFLRYPVGENIASGTKATATPFAIRTVDPDQADAFIVPYAHDAHCNCHQLDTSCPRTPVMTEEVTAMFSSLQYYNTTYQRNRHLFITSKDWPFSHRLIQQVPMRTTIGDLRTRQCLILPSDLQNGTDLRDSSLLCSNIVIPYLNTNPNFQPTKLLERPEEWWTTRPRNLSVAAVFGRLGSTTNFRAIFLENIHEVIQRHGNRNNTIGGLPTHIGVISGERNLKNEQTTYDLYQDSIFCFILPGDGPAQKRFFDVISNGCIPVVFVFHRREEAADKVTINDKHYPSWWDGTDGSIPKQQSLRTSYPFPKGLFLDQPSLGVDYSSFVVQIHNTPGNGDRNNACDFSCGHKADRICQFGCVVPELERIMASPEELQRLRGNLQKASVLLNYGMQENAFQSFDAFAVILANLGHYLERLPPPPPLR